MTEKVYMKQIFCNCCSVVISFDVRNTCMNKRILKVKEEVYKCNWRNIIVIIPSFAV